MVNYRCTTCATLWAEPELLCWLCKKQGERDGTYGLWLLKQLQETVISPERHSMTDQWQAVVTAEAEVIPAEQSANDEAQEDK